MVETFTKIYSGLRDAAKRENDLFSYLSADMSLATLDLALHMLAAPNSYIEQPCYYKADATDDVDTLLKMRLRYVYNGAFA